MTRKTPYSEWEVAVGIRLKKLREDRGLSQNDIVRMTGIPKSTYLRWEWGQGAPPLLAAVRLADVLDVSMDELVGRDRTARKPKGKKGGDQ
jgi:transcriptional regulator with XRE-family HTH domain